MKLSTTLIAALVLALSTASGAWALGDLSQDKGTTACTSETGGVQVFGGGSIDVPDANKGICRDGTALDGVEQLALSPDGRNLYVASYSGEPSSLTIFKRNPRTGVVTQLPGKAGCISEDEHEVDGPCVHGRALDEPEGIVVSPDGKQAYVAGFDSHALAIFDRNPRTGALKQRPGAAGCISMDGTDGHGGPCQQAASVHHPAAVALSPDGKSFYVVSVRSSGREENPVGRSISVFDRDPATGNLTQKPGPAGCVSGSDTGGVCQLGRGLDEPIQPLVSPDGKNVYVTSFGRPSSVLIFDRDPATGTLTQKAGPAGCIAGKDTGGACQQGTAIELGRIAISPDGRNLYLSATNSDAVAVFDRDPTTGALRQKRGRAGCIAEPSKRLRCRKGKGLSGVDNLTISPDGKNIYVASSLGQAVTTFNRETR